MAVPNFVPVGTYTDVTGVVDATAAAEVVVLITNFLALLPNSSSGASGQSPDYDQINSAIETHLRAEMAGLAAAIAAAPTS